MPVKFTGIFNGKYVEFKRYLTKNTFYISVVKELK
ncbi:hypothetical protein SAMN05443633_109161 [Chryseobacterium arachidis]|uniref:Uncharacterized protein n=1 Tax=Chryseobacterium arachidis TaxID=1416778 RepID=A0A1M5GK19_9FLAO|nr:hypothetical protein SAMN05443633_109161 [Chryseobacterium arachidis]